MLKGFQRDVPFTYRDYACLPNDGRRHELIEGDFLVTPAPSTSHQRASGRLHTFLHQQLTAPGIAEVFSAPTDVILSDTTVVQPDLCIVRLSRKGLVSERGIEGPPDVVIEILSPSTSTNDEFVKKALYAKMGVPEYWLVEPNHGFVTVWRAESGVYTQRARFDRASTLSSPEFPQVSLALADVFAKPGAEGA